MAWLLELEIHLTPGTIFQYIWCDWPSRGYFYSYANVVGSMNYARTGHLSRIVRRDYINDAPDPWPYDSYRPAVIHAPDQLLFWQHPGAAARKTQCALQLDRFDVYADRPQDGLVGYGQIQSSSLPMANREVGWIVLPTTLFPAAGYSDRSVAPPDMTRYVMPRGDAS
jgi:hypothetical protein